MNLIPQIFHPVKLPHVATFAKSGRRVGNEWNTRETSERFPPVKMGFVDTPCSLDRPGQETG